MLRDVKGYHHHEVTRDTPRPSLLVQAACTAASISGFHAGGPERAWNPARIDSLLPPGSAASRLHYQEMLDAVALELNQIESSLL